MPPRKKNKHSAPPARGPGRIGALPDDVLHHTAAAAPTPLPAKGWTLPDGVDDNILSEILLRLPPQPSSLPRASAVCKRWHGLARDPGFGRRFRRHHRRNAPLLGVFDFDRYSDPYDFMPTLDAPDLVPAGRFSLLADEPDRTLYESCGSRHGLVFILETDHDDFRHILVWDPITGDQHRIGIPPGFREKDDDIAGAVLRDADDVHFRVVLVLGVGVGDNGAEERRALARVYSSETNLWGDLISVPTPMFVTVDDYPAVLVGDSLYWQSRNWGFCGLLEFNLERQRLDVIWLPHSMDSGCFSVIRRDDGGLGLFSLSGFTGQLWNRKTDSDGVASWVLGRTIQLDKLLSLDLEENWEIVILGYDQKNNYVFLGRGKILFILQLQSLEFRLLMDDDVTIDFPLHSCHPFESVFAAGT